MCECRNSHVKHQCFIHFLATPELKPAFTEEQVDLDISFLFFSQNRNHNKKNLSLILSFNRGAKMCLLKSPVQKLQKKTKENLK